MQPVRVAPELAIDSVNFAGKVARLWRDDTVGIEDWVEFAAHDRDR